MRGYSIVRCFPITGRTHQLRVHLQYLGHPISNDPIYANQRVFGLDLGRGHSEDENDEDIMTRLSRMGKDEVADAVAYHDEIVDAYHKRKAEKMTGETGSVCDTPLYSDPVVHELGIYLHARRYHCEEGLWDYETGLPDWALPPPGMEGPTESTKESDPLAVDLKKLGLEDDETKDQQAPTEDVCTTTVSHTTADETAAACAGHDASSQQDLPCNHSSGGQCLSGQPLLTSSKASP